jgi:carboxyl-terminal processing protease
MMPASNNGVGMNMGFPDVCLTPAGPAVVPIPYPNIAQNCMSSVFSPNVFTGFMPALNMASIKSMTMGDNAGVAHPLFMQMGGQTMGNPIIFVNCIPAKNLLVPTFGNAFNNPVGATLVPSVTTTFYTDADVAGAREASLDAASFRTLERAVEVETVAGGPVVEATETGDGVTVLVLRRFVRDTARRVFNALRRREQDALVIDLRANRGGDAAAALELAGDFLDDGARMATRLHDGDEVQHHSRGPASYTGPVVLVVDGQTASAAELFAGALRANHRAQIVGAPTAGKGSAQQILTLPDRDGVAYASTAEYLLGDGQRLHGEGVTIDVPTADEDPIAVARALLSD